MKLLFFSIALWMSSVAHAAALNLSAFPKLPHVVRDACWLDSTLYFISDTGVYQAAPGADRTREPREAGSAKKWLEPRGGTQKAWEIRQITKTGPADTLWSISCADLLPASGAEIVVSRVRNGMWRSFVLAQDNGGWKFALDEVPFELRYTTWQGEAVWIGDARFPQNQTRGEFFLIDTNGAALKLGKKVRLPRGSVLDNWIELPGGDVAVLRDRRVEIGTGMPRWKLAQHLPAGGLTTLCADSQPAMMSSIGEVVCRRLSPSVWNGVMLTPRNALLVDQVVGHVPMIDHGEFIIYARDPALGVYQTSLVLGPLAGELAAYFIDKNPVDGRDTLFLVVLMRSAAEAVGGLTKYSLLVPVALESLQSNK